LGALLCILLGVAPRVKFSWDGWRDENGPGCPTNEEEVWQVDSNPGGENWGLMIFYGCLSPLSLPARRQSPLFRRLNIRDIDADRRVFTILKQKSSNPLGTLYLLHQA